MKQRYTKNDVQMHSGYPAVNVKDYSSNVHMLALKLNETYPGISDSDALKVVQRAWDLNREMFWVDIRELYGESWMGEEFNPLVRLQENKEKFKICSSGRSDGWLIVMGLYDVAIWDAIDLAYWCKFEKSVKLAVKYYTSMEALLETICANGHADQYMQTDIGE